eukprot:TRINITY_DN3224_c0_g1_i1.p1 TRINITY_DN3224_c0_g1~~TRINITY_DN3224_c0_g1_i1.p1  ORF type:complete len:139 (-),score=16.33 TRINITY_DN3224_c0_g1_i1:193-609(-)
MGVVRLRLARFGCRNRPIYRVVAADSRSRRDGKHLEILGYYDPLPHADGGKRVGLKFNRVKYWLGVGAQPSDPVQRILFRAGLLPPPPTLGLSQKPGQIIHNFHPLTGHPILPSKNDAPVNTDENVPDDIEKLGDAED